MQYWIPESLGSLAKERINSPPRRFVTLFYDTIQMEYQEEKYDRWGGEYTSAQNQAMFRI